MSEPAPVWQCADDDAAIALEKRDNLAELAQAWSDFTDALATVYGVMAQKLPPRLCHDVTLMYAARFMQGGSVDTADCSMGDDDDDV